jgi:hypothetical protein
MKTLIEVKISLENHSLSEESSILKLQGRERERNHFAKQAMTSTLQTENRYI